ncbi:MAG: MauE/DoxX family redox-associated membrane protein, partial [Myxococcota bacterium]
MALTLDPALGLALRGGLALLLGTAAWHKLRDLGAFRDALAGYRLLPDGLVGVAALVLVAAELASACALL